MSLRLINLTIGYRASQPVARSLNAEIASGRLTCLLGRNGTGKTTLLKTLTGTLPPLSGTILLDNEPLDRLSRQQRARSISIVTTHPLDLRQMTVSEVVALGRHPHTGPFGTLTATDRKIVDEAIRLTGIAPLASRDIALLSDGERQKVIIAKALAQQTPLIILDEPTAFLDHPSRRELLILLRQLAEEQSKTILLSTHDWELAATHAHHLLMLTPNHLQPITPTDLPTM